MASLSAIFTQKERERERSFYNSTAMSEAFLWYSFGLKEANTEQSGDVFTHVAKGKINSKDP